MTRAFCDDRNGFILLFMLYSPLFLFVLLCVYLRSLSAVLPGRSSGYGTL